MKLWTRIGRFLGSLLFLAVAVLVLPFSWADFNLHQSYESAPACGDTPDPSCRAQAQVTVSDIYKSSSSSGYDTHVTFSEHGSATFFGKDVPASSLGDGQQVTVELWHGQVAAMVIDGVKHESYAVQPNAWIGVAISLVFVAVGLALVIVPPLRFVLRGGTV